MHAFRCSSVTAHCDSLDHGWLLVDASMDTPDTATNSSILWDIWPGTDEVAASCTAVLRCVRTEAVSVADSCMRIVLRRVRYVRNTVRARVRSAGLHR